MTAANYWHGKTVFVTGINGFIGGNLAKGLHEKGARVIGLIRNLERETFLFYEGLADKVTLIQGDLCDYQLMKRIINEEQVNCVFHLAAQVEVGVARQYPYLTWETNVRGTYTLLEAIREQRETIESVVIASSDKAYGSYPESKMPYKEDYPLIPVYPYDVSKAVADMIAQSYASDLYKMPLVVTRFCNIYGPGQLNFSAIMPDAIRSALGYSKFTPRGNGMQVRDFIYAGDVVNLYLRIGESLAQQPQKIAGQIFNAGTNHPTRVKDVLHMIFSQTDKLNQYSDVQRMLADRGETAIGEIDCQYMDFEKVNKYFGWKPEVSFEAGLQKTIAWFDKYLKDTHQKL